MINRDTLSPRCSTGRRIILATGLLVMSVLVAPVRADVGSVSIGLASGSTTNLIENGVSTGMFTVSVTVTRARTGPRYVGVRMFATRNGGRPIRFNTLDHPIFSGLDFELSAPSGTRWAFLPIGTRTNTNDFFLMISSSEFTNENKTATFTVGITARDVDPSRHRTTTFKPRNARYYRNLGAGTSPADGIGVMASGENAAGSAAFVAIGIFDGVDSVSIGLAPGSPAHLIDNRGNTGMFTVSATVTNARTDPQYVGVRMFAIGSYFNFIRNSTRIEGPDFELSAPTGTLWAFLPPGTATNTSDFFLIIPSSEFTNENKTATFTAGITARNVNPSRYRTFSFRPRNARYYQNLSGTSRPRNGVGDTASGENATGSADFTIVANGIVSLQAGPSSITEGATGGDSTIVTLRLAHRAQNLITIPYTIDDPEGDITMATRTGRFEFSASNIATITITAVDDDKIEPSERFTLTLEPETSDGISISSNDSNSTAAITILDDDGIIVSLQANPSSITEVATSSNSTVVTLRLANQPESSITIPYDIDDTEGDITAATRTGRFEFSATDTTATVTITAVDDDKIEPPEDFTLTLEPGAHNGIFVSEGGPHSTAAITILDDDGIIVSLQANPSSITEVATGGNSTVVTLRLANQPESSITIPYDIDDTEGDITTATRTGRFEFSATDTTATVTITAVDDDKIEPPENFTLTLDSGPHNGIFVSEGDLHSTAAITILDDDSIVVSL